MVLPLVVLPPVVVAVVSVPEFVPPLMVEEADVEPPVVVVVYPPVVVLVVDVPPVLEPLLLLDPPPELGVL